MVNQRIKDYFLEGLKKGYKIEILKQKLLDAGFKKQEINETINSLNSQNSLDLLNSSNSVNSLNNSALQKSQNNLVKDIKPTIQKNIKLGIFKKIGKAITNPRDLFELTSPEGISPAFKYQIIILFIPLIILSVFFFLFFETIFSFILGSFGSFFGTDNTLTVSLVSPLMLLVLLLFFVVFILIVAPILSLIGAGISHLSIKLYGGTGKYKDTYKAIIYGSTPQTLFGVIPIFNIFSYFWGIALTILGISINHKISKWKAFFALITPIILFSLLALIFIII